MCFLLLSEPLTDLEGWIREGRRFYKEHVKDTCAKEQRRVRDSGERALAG